jgi:mono/diheme cytochrome c family protein
LLRAHLKDIGASTHASRGFGQRGRDTGEWREVWYNPTFSPPLFAQGDRMRRWQKALASTVFIVAVLLSAGITATIGWRPIIGPRARPLTDRRFEPTPARLERGAYLVKGVTPCLVCHSTIDTSNLWTPKPGMLGAGQKWVEPEVPWLNVPNITPDPQTGAGSWSDDALARAVREGIGHDGRTLFPMMPYTRFRTMSDEDLASVIAYLRTLPPVRHAVPPSTIPFPVNRFINNVPEPIEGTITADVSSPEKRGEYLVTIAACEDCHTPRDQRDQPVETMAFGGGNVLKIEGRQPIATANLTPSESGIPYYDQDLFIEVMRTGHVRARQLSDVMPWRFYANMTDDDLKAIFAYLKTVKPVGHYVDNSLPPTACARCGHEHGGGERNTKAS